MARRLQYAPLRVYLNNRLVGHLLKEPGGAVSFQYDESWLGWENAIPVSLSLPLREDAWRGAPVIAVFENLLLDSELLRRRVAERIGAEGSDAYSLLTAIGRDCVGALQFVAVCSLSDDDYYGGCMTHALEMLMSGTTTISSTFLNERLAGPVVRDLGVRAVLSEWIVGTNLFGLSARNMERPWDQALVEKGLDAAQDLFESWHGKADGRITTRISPAGPGYLSDKGIEQARDLAKKHGVGINIHIAEVPGETEFVTARYGKRPMELGRDLGVLTPQTIGFHCVFLNDSDIEIMHETGMNLSHTSFHTPKRGYFPPMEKVHKRGVSVSIGSDWCSNDLWKFIRSSILIPRVMTGDVSMMEGYDGLRLATVGGARALGMENEIGTLEVGKKADIILLDLTLPWYRPIREQNLISNIVYNANGSDVTDVFVDGAHVVSNRTVTTIDAEAIMADCQARADRVWSVVSKDW